MALVACRECHASISTTATACPHCGAKPGTDAHTRAGITVLAIAGLAALIWFFSPSGSPPPRPAPQTTAQPPAASAPPADPEQLRNAKRFDLAFDATKAIRAAMRDPASTTFEYVGVNQSGTAACIEYRSRNGFGGMNKESAVYAAGKLTRSTPALIKAHCTGLLDYRHAAQ